jgi:hypothetical protein
VRVGISPPVIEPRTTNRPRKTGHVDDPSFTTRSYANFPVGSPPVVAASKRSTSQPGSDNVSMRPFSVVKDTRTVPVDASVYTVMDAVYETGSTGNSLMRHPTLSDQSENWYANTS